MKRQWRIRHHFRPAADGAQRWDQAYQHLLEWGQVSPASSARLPVTTPPPHRRKKSISRAIYVRVSTERQTQAQTIEQQIERLRRHLTAQGEELQAEDIFRDESYSGATLNRPGLDRLRDQVKAARITRVVIVSPDRLARNYVHQMVLLEEFAQAGCRIEFLERPMSEDR